MSRDRCVHSDPGQSRQGGRRGCGAPGLPGGAETASVAGPCDVIARAQARDIDELGKLAARRVQVIGGGDADDELLGGAPVGDRSLWTTSPLSTR